MTLVSVERYDRDSISRLGEHAIVVGSSVAGLISAVVIVNGGFTTMTNRTQEDDR